MYRNAADFLISAQHHFRNGSVLAQECWVTKASIVQQRDLEKVYPSTGASLDFKLCYN